MGKLLIILGLLLLAAGILVTLKVSVPFFGKMPGDISIKGEHFQFYFPLVTCLILSLVISLLFYLFSR